MVKVGAVFREYHPQVMGVCGSVIYGLRCMRVLVPVFDTLSRLNLAQIAFSDICSIYNLYQHNKHDHTIPALPQWLISH